MSARQKTCSLALNLKPLVAKGVLLFVTATLITLICAFVDKYDISITACQEKPQANHHFQVLAEPERKEASSGTNRSFFFLETAGASCISARQSCAIESAARRNPQMNVILFTAGEMNWKCRYLDVLSKLPNFQYQYPSFEALFEDSVLGTWYRNGTWKRSPFRVNHLSDAMRILVLWKFGGIYADMDVVVLASVSELRNSVSRELFPAVGNSVLVFDKGHPFLLDCMKDFAMSYRPGVWAYNGPRLLERVLLKYCPEKALRGQQYVNCSEVTVLPERAFYPVHQTEWETLFQPKALGKVIKSMEGSYMVHFWNSSSKRGKLVDGSGSAYEVIARFACPATYRFAQVNDQF